MMPASRQISRFREIFPEHKEQFKSCGVESSHFFPHRIYYLPKCGPDGLKMSQLMCGIDDPNASWEVVLYAKGSAAAFPEHLSIDNDTVWRRQPLGNDRPAATANLVMAGKRVYGNNYFAHLLQRVSRSPEHKTNAESYFRGRVYMLLNAILNFARERQLDYVFSPSADYALAQVAADRALDRGLFECIYDRMMVDRYHAVRKGNWWVIDLRENRERLVVPVKGEETLANEKTLCVCHDIERGLGHIGTDSDRVHVANRIAPGALSEMAHIETLAGVKATYNIVGCLFQEVFAEIAGHGHCLAFHSYDHQIHKLWWFTRRYHGAIRLLGHIFGVECNREYQDQLDRCRSVDKHVRGFRPPRSRVTAEWNDQNLTFHDFEWFASSAWRLGTNRPIMHHRLVKIPIHFDDFTLYKHGMSFRNWEQQALATIEHNEFVAFGLHDCYADFWLPHYRGFLEKIATSGNFKTLDDVANETIFAFAA